MLVLIRPTQPYGSKGETEDKLWYGRLPSCVTCFLFLILLEVLTKGFVVLPLANQTGGHRLGVNGLAVDSDNSILCVRKDDRSKSNVDQ